MNTNKNFASFRLRRLVLRRRKIDALKDVLTKEEREFLAPRASVRRLLSRQTIAAAALALVALRTMPALAGGSGLEIETAISPFWVFFVNFVIDIAALVGAGIAFIAGGARAIGNVSVILLGVAFVGFTIPIASSKFGLTRCCCGRKQPFFGAREGAGNRPLPFLGGPRTPPSSCCGCSSAVACRSSPGGWRSASSASAPPLISSSSGFKRSIRSPARFSPAPFAAATTPGALM